MERDKTAAIALGYTGFHPSHCYYINLAHREDRRAFMETTLPALRLPFSRWPGCWIPDLNDIPGWLSSTIETQGVAQYLYENGAILGTLGCYQSHVSLLREIARTEQRQCLVLEDDVEIRAEFFERARALVNQLPVFDIVMFDCLGQPRLEDRYAQDIYRPSANYPHYHGSHTMLVSGIGARRVLDVIEHLPIKDIDGLYLDTTRLNCFVVYTGALKVHDFGCDRFRRPDPSKVS